MVDPIESYNPSAQIEISDSEKISEEVTTFFIDVDNTLVQTSEDSFVKLYAKFKSIIHEMYPEDEIMAEGIYEDFEYEHYNGNGLWKKSIDLREIGRGWVNKMADSKGWHEFEALTLVECLDEMYETIPSPMEGAYEFIQGLRDKGYNIVLWTHSGEEWGMMKEEDILSNCGLSLEDEGVYIETVALDEKKDENNLKMLMNKYGLKPENVCVVGDNPISDIQTGEKAGVRELVYYHEETDRNYKKKSVELLYSETRLRVVRKLLDILKYIP